MGEKSCAKNPIKGATKSRATAGKGRLGFFPIRSSAWAWGLGGSAPWKGRRKKGHSKKKMLGVDIVYKLKEAMPRRKKRNLFRGSEAFVGHHSGPQVKWRRKLWENQRVRLINVVAITWPPTGYKCCTPGAREGEQCDLYYKGSQPQQKGGDSRKKEELYMKDGGGFLLNTRLKDDIPTRL